MDQVHATTPAADKNIMLEKIGQMNRNCVAFLGAIQQLRGQDEGVHTT